ncbi:MAG: phage tail length tape measure family protein [Rhodovulum sp.]
MAFVVQGTITANGEQAQKELRETGRAVDQLGQKARTVSTGMGAAARQTADVGRQSAIAAGSVANLGYQFNDIGVMMAAGQSPLMLAIQQGTQISQVLGPMGAQGAVSALGAAFRSMINPVSLATIGIVAGTAALGQWAMAAAQGEDATEDFATSVDDLVTSMNALQDITAIYSGSDRTLARGATRGRGPGPRPWRGGPSAPCAARQALAGRLPGA